MIKDDPGTVSNSNTMNQRTKKREQLNKKMKSKYKKYLIVKLVFIRAAVTPILDKPENRNP